MLDLIYILRKEYFEIRSTDINYVHDRLFNLYCDNAKDIVSYLCILSRVNELEARFILMRIVEAASNHFGEECFKGKEIDFIQYILDNNKDIFLALGIYDWLKYFKRYVLGAKDIDTIRMRCETFLMTNCSSHGLALAFEDAEITTEIRDCILEYLKREGKEEYGLFVNKLLTDGKITFEEYVNKLNEFSNIDNRYSVGLFFGNLDWGVACQYMSELPKYNISLRSEDYLLAYALDDELFDRETFVNIFMRSRFHLERLSRLLTEKYEIIDCILKRQLSELLSKHDLPSANFLFRDILYLSRLYQVGLNSEPPWSDVFWDAVAYLISKDRFEAQSVGAFLENTIKFTGPQVTAERKLFCCYNYIVNRQDIWSCPEAREFYYYFLSGGPGSGTSSIICELGLDDLMDEEVINKIFVFQDSKYNAGVLDKYLEKTDRDDYSFVNKIRDENKRNEITNLLYKKNWVTTKKVGLALGIVCVLAAAAVSVLTFGVGLFAMSLPAFIATVTPTGGVGLGLIGYCGKKINDVKKKFKGPQVTDNVVVQSENSSRGGAESGDSGNFLTRERIAEVRGRDLEDRNDQRIECRIRKYIIEAKKLSYNG